MNPKKIVLTAKQQKLVMDNYCLIDLACFQNRRYANGDKDLMEEFHSVASEFLCHAASRYSEEKGDFDVYALQTMGWAISTFAKKEYIKGMSISNNVSFRDKKNRCSFTSTCENVPVGTGQLDLVEGLIDLHRSITPEEALVFSKLVDGFTVNEIANDLGISSNKVYKMVNSLNVKAAKIFNCTKAVIA